MGDRRKLENAAFVLPLFGAILLIPPLANVFNKDLTIFGVPLEVLYLFAIWCILIVATFFLSHRMSETPAASRSDAEKTGDES
ncbi:hypothetical protein [Mariluticola halotolerans]|uniref:hypothetical protein n=1 Tax=Mariluticola halotolerans TaxID=2909283 RepID=UPI0026E303E2|nr:hypothetical protein [Mariluticola halotolerans]UJQ95565.1 hypothetical protein L1P08_06140 [Mariluticola halotolerans]